MVYARPRPTPISRAARAKEATLSAYRRALDELPEQHADAVRAYLAAVHAEAAARRIEANRLKAELETRDRGTTVNKNGDRP